MCVCLLGYRSGGERRGMTCSQGAKVQIKPAQESASLHGAARAPHFLFISVLKFKKNREYTCLMERSTLNHDAIKK